MGKTRRTISSGAIITLLTFLMIMIFLVTGLGAARGSSREQAMEMTRRTLHRAVTQCYALEGCYPPDLDYLKENYGIRIDESRFLVHYQLTAANLLPQITIIEKDQ